MCTPNPTVTAIITGASTHTHVRAPVRDFIAEKLAGSDTLINYYPDLYWTTVFVYFDGRVIYDKHRRPGEIDMAFVPTLLDNHGLVPNTDHRPDEGDERVNYRHLMRARVNTLLSTYQANHQFYDHFTPEHRQEVVEAEAEAERKRQGIDTKRHPTRVHFDEQVPRDATSIVTNDGNHILMPDEYHLNPGANAPNFVSMRFVALHKNLMLLQAHKFTLWVKHRYFNDGPSPIKDGIDYYIGRRVQRFRLGFALTVYDQFRNAVGRLKGIAYDLDVPATLQIQHVMQQFNANPQAQMEYMAALVRLLATSRSFVRRYGTEGGAICFKFIEYLIHIGVGSQEWDWPTAIDMAIQMPLVPDGPGLINVDFDLYAREWYFLQVISIMPPREQVDNDHFLRAFVKSMIEYEDHMELQELIQERQAQYGPHAQPDPVSRVQGRTAQLVKIDDSVRLSRENPHVENVHHEMHVPIDPFAVRAKVVWLMFVVPYLQQYVDYFREDGGGNGGPNQFNARPGHGRGGHGGGHGQGQMRPPPPNQPNNNQGNYAPNVYYGMDFQPWNAKIAPQPEAQDCAPASGSSSSNMNGEMDGSEAKKLQDELDPSEQSLNDLNGSFSALHLSTTV